MKFELGHDQFCSFRLKSELGHDQFCIFRIKFELVHDQFCTCRMKSEPSNDQFCIFVIKSEPCLDEFFILQSIKFDHVRVQAGSDSTGVATDMITMNSTLKFTYRNTGTFFGVHVSATPLELSYSDITIASGNVRFTNLFVCFCSQYN